MTRLPEFLLIGAAKSGTSALFRYLKQHPQIYASPTKEPHFFSFDQQSKMTAGPGDSIPYAITDYESYCALFKGAPMESKACEASTSYLYRPEAPERIKGMLPDVKLIALLRNPADRAFSAYMHVIRDGRETAKTFRQALQREEERIAQNWDPIWHYTQVGFYARQLQRYYRIFPAQQIKIFLYEDFMNDQAEVLRSIFQFIGVDDSFVSDTNFKVNVSGKLRSVLLQQWIKRLFDSPNPVRWAARKMIPETVRWKFTEAIRHRNLARERISREDRRFLQPVFREDILALQALLQRDLSNWLET